ncbi:hypothetical protein H9Q69_012553 [Fusarium xylarioides]|nr:hypothetical protein H9Q69_012553 [Fusarium xylarioides]
MSDSEHEHFEAVDVPGKPQVAFKPAGYTPATVASGSGPQGQGRRSASRGPGPNSPGTSVFDSPPRDSPSSTMLVRIPPPVAPDTYSTPSKRPQPMSGTTGSAKRPVGRPRKDRPVVDDNDELA